MSPAQRTKAKRGRTGKADGPLPPIRADDRGEFRGIYRALLRWPDFQALSADARALFYPLKLELGLAGIDLFEVRSLEHLSGMGAQRVSDGIDELLYHGWIRVQEPVVWLRNGLRFDPVNPLAYRNGCRAVVKQLVTLPRLAIVSDFLAYYCPLSEYLYEEWSMTGLGPVPDPSATSPGKDPSATGTRARENRKPITDERKEIPIPNTDTDTENGRPAQSRAAPSDATAPATVRYGDGSFSHTVLNGWQPDRHHANLAAELGKDLHFEAREFAFWHSRQDTPPPRNLNAAFTGWLKKPEPTLATPQAGSEYEAVRLRDDELPQDGSPRSGSGMANVRPRPRKPTDDERVTDWTAAHPTEAAELKTRIAAGMANDPRFQGVGSESYTSSAAKSFYRRSVLELLDQP